MLLKIKKALNKVCKILSIIIFIATTFLVFKGVTKLHDFSIINSNDCNHKVHDSYNIFVYINGLHMHWNKI